MSRGGPARWHRAPINKGATTWRCQDRPPDARASGSSPGSGAEHTFDPETGSYTLHWFDCLGSPPEVFTGRFAGDVLTLAHGGPGMHVRMTTDLGTPGVMVTKMEMSPDGADWKTLFDGRYESA